MREKAILCFNLCQLLRSPFLFFKYPFFLKLSSQFFTKNKTVLNFIIQVLGTDQSEIQNIYYSSGTIKVLSRSHFYKVGSAFGSLKQECENIKIICKRFPKIVLYLRPTKYKKIFFLRSVTMDHYPVVDRPDSMSYANQILQAFAHYAITRKCSMNEFPHILRGFKLAKILYQSVDLDVKAKAAFSVFWKIGPVHGDFHMGNILVDNNHSPFVIDLDNFNINGIQAIDAFTFWVDYQTKEMKISWQEVIRLALKTDIYMGEHDIKLIAFLYLLNRLGFENFYYGFLSRSIQNEFRLLEELIMH